MYPAHSAYSYAPGSNRLETNREFVGNLLEQVPPLQQHPAVLGVAGQSASQSLRQTVELLVDGALLTDGISRLAKARILHLIQDLPAAYEQFSASCQTGIDDMLDGHLKKLRQTVKGSCCVTHHRTRAVCDAIARFREAAAQRKSQPVPPVDTSPQHMTSLSQSEPHGQSSLDLHSELQALPMPLPYRDVQEKRLDWDIIPRAQTEQTVKQEASPRLRQQSASKTSADFVVVNKAVQGKGMPKQIGRGEARSRSCPSGKHQQSQSSCPELSAQSKRTGSPQSQPVIRAQGRHEREFAYGIAEADDRSGSALSSSDSLVWVDTVRLETELTGLPAVSGTKEY